MKFKPYISVFLTSVLLAGCSMFDETSTIGGDVLGNQDNSLDGYDGTFTTDQLVPRDLEFGYSLRDAFGGLHSYSDSLFVNGGKQGHRVIGSWGNQKSYITMQFAPYDDTIGSTNERISLNRNLEMLDSINDLNGGNGVFDFNLVFTVNSSRSTNDRYNLELFKIGTISHMDTAAPTLDSVKAAGKAISINYGTVSGNTTVGSIPISLDYHSNKTSVVDTLIYFTQQKNHSYTVESFTDTIYKFDNKSIFVYGDTTVSTPIEVTQTDEAFEASILPYNQIVAYQLPYSHGSHHLIEDSLILATESITDINSVTTTTHTIKTASLYSYTTDTVFDTLTVTYKTPDMTQTIVGVDTTFKDTTEYYYAKRLQKVKGARLDAAAILASEKVLDTLIEKVGDYIDITHPKDAQKIVNAKRSTIFYPSHEYRKAASVVNTVTDTLDNGVTRTIYEKSDTIFTYAGNIVNQYEIVDTNTNISITDLTMRNRANLFTHIDSTFNMALDFSEFQNDSSLLSISNIVLRASLTLTDGTIGFDFPANYSQMTVVDSNDATLNSNTVAVSDGGTQRFARLKMNMHNFWNTVQQNDYRTLLYSDLKLYVEKVELPDYHNDTIVVKGLLLDTLYKDGYAVSSFLAQNREDRTPFTFSVVKDSASVMIDNQILTDNILDILYGDRYKKSSGLPDCYLYLWIEDGHLGRVYWNYSGTNMSAANAAEFTYILQDKK